MLIQLLSNPATVVALSAALIAFALWGALRFEANVKQLRSVVGPLLNVLKVPEDTRSFAQQFDEIAAAATSAVERDSVLETEWQLCVQNFVNEDNRVTSAHQIDDLFLPARVLHRPPIMAYRSLPGVLIGLGLVFTFAGISMVISQAGAALDEAGNLDALHKLLSAAGLKFITSLVGVGLSVVCGLHYRMRTTPVIETLSLIKRRIQLLAPNAGQGDLLLAITSLRSDVALSARTALSDIIDHATTALTEAVTNQMSAVATPVHKLTEAVDASAARFTSINEQIDACTTRLAETIEIFTTKLGESSESLCREFATIRSHACDTTKEFAKVATAANKVGNSADKLKEMIMRLETVVSSLSKLGPLPDDLKAATASLGRVGTELSSLWAGYTTRLEAADRQLSRSVDVLPSIFEQYADALKSYTSDLDAHLSQILQSLQQWVEHIARLQEAAVSPREP